MDLPHYCNHCSSESDTEDLHRASGSWDDDDGGGARRRGALIPVSAPGLTRAAAATAAWEPRQEGTVNGGGGRDDNDDDDEEEEDGDEGGPGGEVFQTTAAGPPAADERHQLVFERNRLRQQKRQLEELLDHSEDSNKQLSETVKNLQKELTNLRRTDQQLRRRLEDEASRAEDMERRAASSERLGDSLRLEVGRLKERNTRLKDELRQSQGNIADFLKDVAEKKASIRKLEADLAGFRSSCGRLAQQQLPQKQPPAAAEATRSIRDEILSQDCAQLDSGPSPFCEKQQQPQEVVAEALAAVSSAEATVQQNHCVDPKAAEQLDMTTLLEERNLYRQQLQEAMTRIQSTAAIIQYDLLNKFTALEQQVRLERQENHWLSEQLKSNSRRSTVCSDSACQVGEAFMAPDAGRYEARFPRSFLRHPSLMQHRRLSTGRICKSFKAHVDGRQRLDSSVDALDLAVKSSAASAASAASDSSPASPQVPLLVVTETPSVPGSQSASVAASAPAPSDGSCQHRLSPDSQMATGGGSGRHGNLFARRKRRVSFGAPLSQVSPEHEKYLMDLVRRPVQDDDSLTEEDKRVSSMLLRQAAEASRRREDSASSPEGSPRHLKRPSRTSSSFMSSLKQESDYSMWSHSEPAGASLSISVDDFSQSQAEPPPEVVQPSRQLAGLHRGGGGGGGGGGGSSDESKEPLPFPSLPDGRLRDLTLLPGSLTELDARNGSVSLIDPGRRFRLDDVPDSELEDRVRALAISFSNDATTLVGRVKRLSLARANLERNIASELDTMESGLASLKFGSGSGGGVQVPTVATALALPTPAGIQVLRDSVDRLNRTAEILGAVKQESRLNYAFHLMMKYMELLKEEKEKQLHELEQMRQAMEEGKFFMPDEEMINKRSKSVIGGSSQSKDGQQRPKFQDVSRNIARTSSITTLRRKMSREGKKSTDEADSDKCDHKDKKWKIEEEIYQSGFERGVRMSASQQLSQLKTEQATFSEQLEKMLDRQHLTEGEEADLDRLSADWLSDKRIRLFLAPFTLLVTLVFLLWAVAYPIAKQIVGH